MARCHSFSLSLLCHEADVTDQSARQLVQGKVWLVFSRFQGVLASSRLQPPAALSPAPYHLMLKVCSHHGT